MHPVENPRAARFTELYAANYPRVWAYCRRRLPAEIAADAVAETFVSAWRNLDRLSGDPLLWLYGLARGVVANQRRGLARAKRLHERVRTLAPPRAHFDHAGDLGVGGVVLEALGQLSPDQQEALRLTAWEGLTPSEAAAVVGCSAATLKVRAFRARRRMRQLLETDARAVGMVPRPARSRPGLASPVISASTEGDGAR